MESGVFCYVLADFVLATRRRTKKSQVVINSGLVIDHNEIQCGNVEISMFLINKGFSFLIHLIPVDHKDYRF